MTDLPLSTPASRGRRDVDSNQSKVLSLLWQDGRLTVPGFVLGVVLVILLVVGSIVLFTSKPKPAPTKPAEIVDVYISGAHDSPAAHLGNEGAIVLARDAGLPILLVSHGQRVQIDPIVAWHLLPDTNRIELRVTVHEHDHFVKHNGVWYRVTR
jgi:hypothetical protein